MTATNTGQTPPLAEVSSSEIVSILRAYLMKRHKRHWRAVRGDGVTLFDSSSYKSIRQRIAKAGYEYGGICHDANVADQPRAKPVSSVPLLAADE